MTDIERRMAVSVESAVVPSTADLGGVTALMANASLIAASPLLPDFLRVVLGELPSAATEELSDFVCRCMALATNEFSWVECVDLLTEAHLPRSTEDRLFEGFLATAADRTLPAISRSAALDGAARWACEDRRRQLRLSSAILEANSDDSSVYLARVAKVAGLAYAQWREPGVEAQLSSLEGIHGVADEAAFELGSLKLLQGLEATDAAAATERFKAALFWFERALSSSEQRPDAKLYARCMEVLISFSAKQSADKLESLAASISDAAFELYAWHSSDEDPPWFGARRTEAAMWELLAVRLKSLARDLESQAWWEPAVVIEQHLIAVYCAGRSILKRDGTSGLNAMVRPRVESTLAAEQGKAHLLRTWLKHNAADAWAQEAQALVERVDAIVAEARSRRPPEAAPGKTVAALLADAALPPDVKTAIADTMQMQLDNMSGAEQAIIEDCIRVAQRCADYCTNTVGRKLFHAVLLWTVRFLMTRLELTRGDAPTIDYLFERQNHALPHESELQADYYGLMASNVIGTEIEVTNIGGGRADVCFTYAPERLVTEVKREGGDTSFEELERSYAGQTTDYQNVSIRFGFLLVLDQSELRTTGTPHISSLVHPSLVARKGETEPRLVVIVKVPGRRLRPSDVTKAAKRA